MRQQTKWTQDSTSTYMLSPQARLERAFSNALEIDPRVESHKALFTETFNKDVRTDAKRPINEIQHRERRMFGAIDRAQQELAGIVRGCDESLKEVKELMQQRQEGCDDDLGKTSEMNFIGTMLLHF